MMYLISSCLAGFDCKYNGKNNANRIFVKMVKQNKAIPFCPEQAGGLSTPRPPSEIRDGDGIDVICGNAKVITVDDEDVTEFFIKGAKETLKLVRLYGIDKAILKSRSPSCGCLNIYDGSFKGVLRKGIGVTSAYLKQNGVEVFDSDEFLNKINSKNK